MVNKSTWGQRVLALPKWLAIGLVVVASVGGSIVATLLLKYAQGQPVGLFETYMLVPATVPMLISAPIAGFILNLMHSVEAARQEAQRLSRTDLLTGALNRRRFIEVAQRELDRAKFVEHPMSVLLLDIDDFKRVNDKYGHDVGDAVLKMVAKICEQALRPGDPFARWGGEEFVAMLPGAKPGDAISVALRLRDAIAAGVVGTAERAISVTASIGVAGSERDAGSLDELLIRADQAMYQAKRGGKNMAVIAMPMTEHTQPLPGGSAQQRASPLEIG